MTSVFPTEEIAEEVKIFVGENLEKFFVGENLEKFL